MSVNAEMSSKRILVIVFLDEEIHEDFTNAISEK
jgi:hypothetical protein